MALTIAEAAERTGLTAHTLRYYENDGLLWDVERSSSGHRVYSEGDLEWIAMLVRLRATGMPIRDVRRYAELVRGGEGEAERLQILERHRDVVKARLEAEAAHLASIEAKIDFYTGRSDSCG